MYSILFSAIFAQVPYYLPDPFAFPPEYFPAINQVQNPVLPPPIVVDPKQIETPQEWLKDLDSGYKVLEDGFLFKENLLPGNHLKPNLDNSDPFVSPKQSLSEPQIELFNQDALEKVSASTVRVLSGRKVTLTSLWKYMGSRVDESLQRSVFDDEFSGFIYHEDQDNFYLLTSGEARGIVYVQLVNGEGKSHLIRGQIKRHGNGYSVIQIQKIDMRDYPYPNALDCDWHNGEKLAVPYRSGCKVLSVEDGENLLTCENRSKLGSPVFNESGKVCGIFVDEGKILKISSLR